MPVGNQLMPSEYVNDWHFIPVDFSMNGFAAWRAQGLTNEEVGALFQFSVDGDEYLRLFREYVKKHPEWTDVAFEVGMMAKRTRTHG